MPPQAPPERKIPNRGESLVFQGKAALLRAKRALIDLREPLPRHRPGLQLVEAPILTEISADLWNHRSPVEFPLTAGKVQNLRVACHQLNGLELGENMTFSFWKQLGRVTRHKGYTTGRELREGCLVANIGGGLCQLSNLLYNAALDAGMDIVERHAHSRTIPGSLAEAGRDATVFWNYVDLRFKAPFPYRLETILTSTELTVRIRAERDSANSTQSAPPTADPGAPVRSTPSGDCQTCGMTSCFRHPGSDSVENPAAGHSSFLLDACWPEFQVWCATHSRKGDHWATPIDGRRWKKPNYAWSPPEAVQIRHASRLTLQAAFQSRRIPSQGAVRQRALLKRDADLARHYARILDPRARHLVIAQNLLPHLWQQGALGGRTFDVLMTRWPIAELQLRLDEAKRHHPESATLNDFRADPALANAEAEALDSAARLITPHQAIAAHFGERALLLEWILPAPEPAGQPPTRRGLFFPASPLARKGIFELTAALRNFDSELLVLGQATEAEASPLATVPHRPARLTDLLSSQALILPAWIEHQPRLALRALANGIPVIATRDCGLSDHPLLCQIDTPSPEALHDALRQLLQPEPNPVADHVS